MTDSQPRLDRSAASDGHASEGLRSTGWSLARFGLVLAAIWLVLFVTWRALPHIRPGHSQIYEMKQREVDGGRIFPVDDRLRVIVFGNSRVLSGFIPGLFDSLSGDRVVSYNLGLPDSGQFIEEIETLVARGQSPTHVVLTIPWSGRDRPPAHAILQNDRLVMDSLFPFRYVIRDLAQFVVRAASRGGIAHFYRHNIELVERARSDRGYFFIENQSHHAGHRLPDDFRTDGETPETPWVRDVSYRGPVFDRLVDVTRREGIVLVMAPTYYREGLYAPAPSNEKARQGLADEAITLAGPDYWLYPNRYFSDPTHLNREGADLHTRRLWDLLQPYILPGLRAAATP